MKLTFKVQCSECGITFIAGDPRTHICKNADCISKNRESKKTELLCAECKRVFKGFLNLDRFCSDRCKKDAGNRRLREKRAAKPPKMKVCVVCGAEFQANGSSVTCSKECSDIHAKDTLSKWRTENPDYRMRSKTQQFCIMCGEPVPIKHYTFCSEECTLMHRRIENLYKQGVRNPVHDATCIVCLKTFPTTHKTRSICSKECMKRIKGCFSEFKDRRQKAQARAASLEQYKDTKPLGTFNGINTAMEFAETLGIERTTSNACRCLRCNKEFVICKDTNGAALTLLRSRELLGKSPCPYCGDAPIGSKHFTLAIAEIKALFPNFTVANFKPDWMDGLEIDLWDPVNQVGIEYHGIIWHSTKMRGDDAVTYHSKKADLAAKAGIQLIQVFETEWYQYKNVVISMIKRALNMSDIITAGACDLVTSNDMRSAEFKKFMLDNSMTATCKCDYFVGLLYNGSIYGVCAVAQQGQKCEIVNWTTRLNTVIDGGLAKCISYIKELTPTTKQILLCANRRFYTDADNEYISAGLRNVGITTPTYMLTDLNAKHKLISPASKRQHEKTLYRIYDAGNAVYELSADAA